MTIFIKALKALINQQLDALKFRQNGKTTVSFGNLNNKLLSGKQRDIVGKLIKSVNDFEATGDDKKDQQAIMELVINTHREIQLFRRKHKKAINTGDTITTLNAIHSNIPVFYTTLLDFGTAKKLVGIEGKPRQEFMLLNMPWKNNPFSVVCYHAAHYLGDDIFTPSSSSDKVRYYKEQSWALELDQLSRLITSDLPFEKHKSDCLARLDSLTVARKKAAKIDSDKYTFALWGLAGAIVNANVKSAVQKVIPASARMKDEIAMAKATIENMNMKEYEPFAAPTAISAAGLVLAASKPKPVPAKPAAKRDSGSATSSTAGSPIPPIFTAGSSGAASTKAKPVPVKSGSASASPKAQHVTAPQSPTPSFEDAPESFHGDSDDDSAAVPPNPNAGAAAAVVYKKLAPPGFFAAGAKAGVTTVAAAAAAAEDEDDLYDTQGVSVDDCSGVEAEVSAYAYES